MLKIKENIGKSILKLTLEKIFIGNDIRSIGKKKKKKKDKWDYIKLKNYCATKKTISQVKKKPM